VITRGELDAAAPTSGPGTAQPSSVLPPFSVLEESASTRDALSALARLLGASIDRPRHDLASFVAYHLAAPAAASSSVTSVLRGVDAPLVHVVVGRLIETAPSAVLADDVAAAAPGYELVAVDVDETVAAPDDLAAFLPAGEAFAFDCVLVLTWQQGVERIALHVRTADHEAARRSLAELLSRARGVDNFYRGKTLRVNADDDGVHFMPVERSATRRDEVVLAPAVWAEVDANVTGLVEHGAVLAAAGLGASRGILIAGPPGVGKTALCRAIASELPPATTILLVDATVTARGLGLLYESLSRLAPAAVFLDDIDLLAGDRRSGTGGGALRELLTHLDGFAPAAAVLTVATTNDVRAIDPALIRAGRFDCVIEVGAPDRTARCAILARYLRAVGADAVPVATLAARTEGATGSDLREIVRRAVLERGPALAETDLLDVVASGRWKPAPVVGQYL
jgi:hypothetical protein